MGEADVVRRGFAKKLGTGDFIPIIKNGGYLNGNKNHYIKGFIQTMKDDYGYDEEFSQKAIIEFIQVIEDASSYLFSINHSYPYSFEGYVSGYLRYYYPVEFITTALNIHSGNEEKTNKITEYAKKQNIKILPIKFRHSKDTYSPDKENNAIYKGIASVKFLNAEVAQQMYEMREQEFPTFIDFLKVNPCNSRQTEILIKLDFFSEFGKSQKLLDEYEIYTTYYGKKQFKKEKITLDDETMSKFATSTDKMYKITDSEGLIKELCNRVEDKSIPIKERLTAEAEYLGYIDYINPKATNYGYVLDIDTKYSPRIKMYRLDTGETVTYKLAKKDYNNNPISNHDLLKFTFERRNKSRLVDGKWQKCLEEFEDWIKTYVVKWGDVLKHYYTEKEYKILLSHLVILHDTRENTNSEILDFFNKQGISHEKRALKTGDYSFKISACEELGIHRDMFFTDTVCIERKNSVSEIAGNFCEKDDRFLKELNRMINIPNCYILIENDSLQDVIDGNYKSKLNSLSLLRSLLTTQKRSGFYLYFVKSESMGQMIYEICKNVLDNSILK